MYTYKRFKASKPVVTILLIGLALVAWGIVELTGNALAEPGKGGGKKGSTECQIKFDVRFDDESGHKVCSDGKGIYQSGEEKVIAFTNRGHGFRFDTNGSQKLEQARAVRHVVLDFTDVSGAPFVKEERGVDLWFDLTEGGLQPSFCSLPNGGSGEVDLNIVFSKTAGKEEPWALSYGDEVPKSKGAEPIPVGLPVDVTRIDEVTWTIEGTKARLIQGGLYGDVIIHESDIDMPFLMMLEAQNGEVVQAPPALRSRPGLTSTWGRMKKNRQ